MYSETYKPYNRYVNYNLLIVVSSVREDGGSRRSNSISNRSSSRRSNSSREDDGSTSDVSINNHYNKSVINRTVNAFQNTDDKMITVMI